MKRIFLSIVLTLVCTIMASASGGPEENKLFATANISVHVLNVQQKSFFKYADYNPSDDALEFVTKDKVKYIRIYKNSKLMYQLPVMSNKLKIARAMFSQGTYNIGFITDAGQTINFTQLEIY